MWLHSEISTAEGDCKHFIASLLWLMRVAMLEEEVLTVSFYSWELRTCYLFKGDVAAMPPLLR